MKSIKIILTILIIPFLSFGQGRTTMDYVEKYKGIAIREMKRTAIPASITLAQAILESASGESNLAKNANNHFGVKCKTEWKGPKIYQNDDIKNECFRVYPNADSSFIDHSNFLKNRPYYAALFELDPVDDTAWAYGLKKAGYATEPDYPQRLLKIIDDYELAQYNYPELVEEDSINNIQKNIPIINVALKKKVIDTPTFNVNAISKKEVPTLKDTITFSKSIAIKKEAITTKDTNEKKRPAPYPINKRFKINQTTGIWGEKGRSFLEIANTYQLPLYKLYKFNELPERDILEIDQIIFLAEKKKECNNKIHIVREEETLYEICQSEGIQFNVIKLYNPKLSNEKLKNGTIVYLSNIINEPILKPAILNVSQKKIDAIQKQKRRFNIPFFKK